MDSDKMADEKFEHRKGSTVEEGFGDVDESIVKKALWKMDIRYVVRHTVSVAMVLMFPEFCRSLHYCSCALSSIVPMSETQRFWVSKTIFISMTISTLLACACSTLHTLRGISHPSLPWED